MERSYTRILAFAALALAVSSHAYAGPIAAAIAPAVDGLQQLAKDAAFYLGIMVTAYGGTKAAWCAATGGDWTTPLAKAICASCLLAAFG